MGRPEHGGSLPVFLEDYLVEPFLDEGVEAARGFIEDEELRLVHERLDYTDLFLVAKR